MRVVDTREEGADTGQRTAIISEADGVSSRAIVRTIAVSDDEEQQAGYSIVGDPKK